MGKPAVVAPFATGVRQLLAPTLYSAAAAGEVVGLMRARNSALTSDMGEPTLQVMSIAVPWPSTYTVTRADMANWCIFVTVESSPKVVPRATNACRAPALFTPTWAPSGMANPSV